MRRKEQSQSVGSNVKTGWVRYILIALGFEKIVQHVVVSVALYFDWMGIRSTVVVNPSILMALGAVVAPLFVLSILGMIRQRKRALDLLIALALFDMIGEFVAQGKIGITITVSFLVATILLILTLSYRRQAQRGTM